VSGEKRLGTRLDEILVWQFRKAIQGYFSILFPYFTTAVQDFSRLGHLMVIKGY